MKPLTPEMVNFIQYGTEERRWEFKPALNWNSAQKKEKCEITKAVFALANIRNGGFIVFGISQSRDRSEGMKFERTGMSKEQFNSFDNGDDIARFFRGKANLSINFEVFGGLVKVSEKRKSFVVIYIQESQEAIPVICNYDYKAEECCYLKVGSLYIRSLSYPVESKIIGTNEEWTELIRRLLERKEEIIYKDLEALCKNIRFEEQKSKDSKIYKSKSGIKYARYLKRDKL